MLLYNYRMEGCTLVWSGMREIFRYFVHPKEIKVGEKMRASYVANYSEGYLVILFILDLPEGFPFFYLQEECTRNTIEFLHSKGAIPTPHTR